MNSKISNSANQSGVSVLHDESGTAVMELLMSFPIVIFVILLLIGLGHTLITKQHALVAARYTAQYRIVRKSTPSSAQLAKAVSGGQGGWNISVSDEGSESSAVGQLESGAQDGIYPSVTSFFTRFLNSLSGSNRQVAIVSTKPKRGILPRIFKLSDAKAIYVIEHDTWTCEGNRGSYLSILSSEIDSRAGSIPFLGYVTGTINRVLSSIPCCKPYQSPNEGH